MITSVANPQVKLVRSLARRRARHAARQFVIEGVRSIEEALGAGISPALAFYVARVESDPRARTLVDSLRTRAGALLEVSEPVMQALSNTETPSGLLAVLPFVELPHPQHPGFVLILDSVREPGNLGTILRSAWAAGVDLVWCAPGTADPYNDKVVRAAMGAHFHIPLRLAAWEQIQSALQAFPRIYLADARGESIYSQVDWSHPLALIIGGEAEGATLATRQIATARVRIPMRGGAESLNAAMAATVLLFAGANVI